MEVIECEEGVLAAEGRPVHSHDGEDMGQQEVLVLLRALRIPGLCLIFSGSIFSQCFARSHITDPVFDQIKSHTLGH